MKKVIALSMIIISFGCKNHQPETISCNCPLIVKKSTKDTTGYNIYRYSDTCVYCRYEESLDFINHEKQYAVSYALRILYKQKDRNRKEIDSLEEVASDLRQESYLIQGAKDDFTKLESDK